MKTWLGILGLALLCGCSVTTFGEVHIQVAPQLVTCPAYTSDPDGPCLVARMDDRGTFGNWLYLAKKDLAHFTFTPGTRYELTLQTSCTRGGPGEFFDAAFAVKTIDSAVPTSDPNPTVLPSTLYMRC